MAANAAEKARETGDVRCERCHVTPHVTRGDEIPRCPNHGNDIWDTRRHEPGNGSS